MTEGVHIHLEHIVLTEREGGYMGEQTPIDKMEARSGGTGSSELGKKDGSDYV